MSSKNLDSNERGYALIGKPEDMHTWFFLYDETMRVLEPDTVEMTHNLNYSGYHGPPGHHNNKPRVDMSASLSVPNLDQTDSHAGHHAAPPVHGGGHVPNFYAGHNHPAAQTHYIPQTTHQQQAQHNFMMYGHAQSVQAPAPPTPPMMDHHAPTAAPQAGHGHHCGGGLSGHHSRSVPSVAAAVANSSIGNGSGGCSGGGQGSGSGTAGQHACDPYASRTSLNHEIAMNSSSSRPQSRSHSHHCQQQGCADYPSG